MNHPINQPLLHQYRRQPRPANGNTLLICVGFDGVIRSVEGPLIHLLGYIPENFLGKSLRDMIPQKDRVNYDSLFDQCVDRNEFGIYRTDGSTMYADTFITMFLTMRIFTSVIA